MRLEDILRCLENERTKTAREALESPSDKSLFGYGRAVGLLEGIDIVKQAIVRMHTETEERRERM